MAVTLGAEWGVHPRGDKRQSDNGDMTDSDDTPPHGTSLLQNHCAGTPRLDSDRAPKVAEVMSADPGASTGNDHKTVGGASAWER